MKKLFFLLFIVILGKTTQAQDLLIKNNGDTIRAKIIEISDEVIRYKKQNNLNGPTFVSNKSEIKKLVYANGTEELVVAPVPLPSKQGETQPKSGEPNIDYKVDNQSKIESKEASPVFVPIEIERTGYFYEGRRMNSARFDHLYKSFNDPVLIKEYNKAKHLHTASVIAGAVGIPFAVSGVIMGIISAIPVEEYDDYSGDSYITHPYSYMLTPAIGAFTTFLVLETAAIVFNANYKSKLRSTAEHYNHVIAKHEVK